MNDLEQPGIDSAVFRLRNGSLGLSLCFRPEALAALTAEIGAGFMSIPRRGAEVGGALAGEMTQEGSEWFVRVDRITPVPIEYQYGPSYRLSAADKQGFHAIVNNGSHLIGWYRSNTRTEQEPDEADRQISQTFFSSQSIFLFCKPSADGQIQASCIVMLPRRVQVAFSFKLGKFSRIEALFHSPVDADPPALAPPPATPPPARALASAALTPVATRPALLSRNVKVAAAMLAIAGGVWYARARVFTATTARASSVPASRVIAPPAAPGSLLGLRADYQKDSLLIGWDRTAPELASAASATFRIADGAHTRTLNLSPRELRNGSIVYKPNADEISVELDVTSREGATASQSIRIVGATLEPRSPADPAPHPVIQQEKRAAVSPRPFQLPPEVSPTAPREIATPDLPPIVAAASGKEPELIASALPALREALPGFTQTRREFRPAQPIRSPQPVLPAGIRLPDYAYDRPLQIQVEVNIGRDGSVSAARLTGESGPYAGLLGPSALNTARMWRFRPATLGGEAIPSTMVLMFRYARPR